MFYPSFEALADETESHDEADKEDSESPYNITNKTIAGNKVVIFNFEKKSKKEKINLQYPDEIYTAYFFEQLQFNALLPDGLDSDPPDIDIANVLFLSGPHDFDVTVTKENIPPEIFSKIEAGWGKWEDIPVKNGLLFRGCLDAGKNLDLRKSLESLGVKFRAFPIAGTLGIDPMDLLLKRKKYLKDDFLKGLSLEIDLDLPTLKGIDQFFGFDTFKLGLSSGIYYEDPWSRLPEAMTEGVKKKHDLNLFFSGGAWIKIAGVKKGLNALIDITAQDKKTRFTLLGLADEKFDFSKLLDIPIDFGDDCGYRLILDTSSGAVNADITGFSRVSFNEKSIDVVVDFNLDEKKERPELHYIEFDDDILLSDIVGSRLSGKISDNLLKLGLNKLRLQPDGFSAQATLFSEPVDFFLFDTGEGPDKGVNLVFGMEKSITLDQLCVEKSGKDALKKVALPGTLFFFSEKGISVTRKEITSDILKQVFDKVYEDPDQRLKMNGAGFLCKFDQDNFGTIGKAAKKLGAEDDTMVLADMAGVFDSRPFAMNLYLLCDIKKTSIPAAIKKLVSFPKDTIPRIHLGVMKDEISLGLGAQFNLGSKGGLPGALAGEVQVDLDDDGLGLNFLGRLEAWTHPFDMPSITLQDVMFEIDLDDEATIKPGFGSKVNYLGHDVQVDGSLRMELGDGGFPLPTGVAFKGAIDTLDSETWMYVDDVIVLIIVVAVLALIAGGAGFLLIGLLSGGTAWIVAGAVGAAVGVTGLALFTNVIGPSITVAVIGDIVVENVAHPDHLKKSLNSLKKLEVGDGLKQLVDAAVVPVKTDFKAADKAFAALEAKIVTLKDAYLSFASPGAEDAGNNIPEGLYVHGEAYLFDTIPLGSQSHKAYEEDEQKESGNTVTATATSANGASVYQGKKGNKARDFTLGPLHFTGNQLYTRPDPLGMTSTVKLFGVQEAVTLKFDNGLYFDTDTTLGDLGDINLRFTWDQARKDFIILADLTSTITAKLETEIEQGVNEIIQSAHLSSKQVALDLKSAKKDVTTAQAKVSDALQQITDKIEKDPGVQALESKVNNAVNYLEHGVYDDIDKLCDKTCCHEALGIRKCIAEGACKTGLGYMVKGAGRAVSTLKEELNTAKDKVQIPKALSKAVDTANDDLTKATGLLNQIQSLGENISGATTFLTALEEDIDQYLKKNAIVVDKAVLTGSFSGLQKGLSLVLAVTYVLDGNTQTDYFGFKPGDADYNARALALLPVRVLDACLHQIDKDSSQYLTNWLMSIVDAQLAKAIKDVETELQTEEKGYEKVANTILSVRNSLAGYRVGFHTDLARTAATYSRTDLLPPSKTFKRRYLAVGHSALCLGVAENGVDVYQENCRDIGSEQWSAHDFGNGYVQLKSDGLCLKARAKDNSNTNPLILARCNGTDLHEQWKILSADGFFDKVVNRYSEKCLHFDSENANPKTAYAVWTPCLGMDSQTFRDIDDAQRPTWHRAKDQVEARAGVCLSAKKEFISYFKKNKKGHLTATRSSHTAMQHRAEDVLVTGNCSPSSANTFNYVEMVDGDIKLVHADTGWCVAPQSKTGGKLVLTPCNRNANQLWDNRPEGDGFTMENRYLKDRCISLEPPQGKQTQGRAQLLRRKGNDKTQDIRFKK